MDEKSESKDPLNATVVQRVDLTPVLSILRVRHEAGDGRLTFEPGQFATLGLPTAASGVADANPVLRRRRKGPRLVRRAYSIASAPGDSPGLEFFVAKVEGGRLTPQLWNVPEGGRLYMDDKIKGEFTLAQVPMDSDVLMIATGTGVAPFVSMARAYSGLELWHGRGRWCRCSLVHTARRAKDLAYHEDLAALAVRDSTFRYLPTLTREPEESDWEGSRGRPGTWIDSPGAADLLGFELKSDRCHVMLCGNPAMIDEMSQLFDAKGFTYESGNLHFERYW